MGKDIAHGEEMKMPQLSDDISLLSKLRIFTEESMTDSMDMEHDSALMFHVSEFLDGPLLSMKETSRERPQLSDKTSLDSMLAIFAEESMSNSSEIEHDSALMFYFSEFLDCPLLSISATSTKRPQLSGKTSLLSMLDIFMEERVEDGLEMEDDELVFQASDFLLSPNACIHGASQFSVD